MPSLHVPNVIRNPFNRGQRILIPAGTPLRSTHPRRNGVYLSKRAQYVTLYMVSDGHVDLWNDAKMGRGFVNLPTASWAGAGPYWVDVRITPELCKANGVEAPTMPDFSEVERARLDVEPGYGLGHDNRDR